MIARNVLAAALVSAALLAGAPAGAKDKPAKAFVVVNEDVGVPVFPNDITDRPYEEIGPVKAEVRKGTIFSKEAGQGKIYKELWERAEKLGADAVIKAEYGDARVTMLSWGSVKASGIAIRFKDAPAAPAGE